VTNRNQYVPTSAGSGLVDFRSSFLSSLGKGDFR
jgi:hypothetical protein